VISVVIDRKTERGANGSISRRSGLFASQQNRSAGNIELNPDDNMRLSLPAALFAAPLLLMLLLLLLLLGGAEAKLPPRTMQAAADEATTCLSCASHFNGWSPKDKRCYFVGTEDGTHGKRLPAANMWLEMAKKDPKLLVRKSENCPGMKREL